MPTEPSEPEDEQDEKRRILANDLSVRDSGTFLSHTHSEAGGRFASVESQQVIGRDGPPHYPALPASSPWHGTDPVPDEPPLGYRIDAMPELEPPTVDASFGPVDAQATNDPAAAPSSGAVSSPSSDERAGSSSSQGEAGE